MIGIPVGGVRVETNSQYPEELARYVRTEFGDESPAWLIREAQNGSKKGVALGGSFAVPLAAKSAPVSH